MRRVSANEFQLTGKHWIAGSAVPGNAPGFYARGAESGLILEPMYGDATARQIESACQAAVAAHDVYRSIPDERRAVLLEAIAQEVEAAGDSLLDRCHQETGLAWDRLQFERLRTVNQARLFAEVVRDGSWSEARIDHAQQEQNRPDCRSLWLPLGPVAVFGASNFPLAISVVGNDTIAALAAGCSVVVKAHPGHPGTCDILAQCLNRAIGRCDLPPGLFSLLHGKSHEVGQRLVQNPGIQAVGFTGSLAGGRALFDAACQRPQLIPVYAEMGSVNPIFFLPNALRHQRWQQWVQPLACSVAAGCGQMCTQPGLLLGIEDENWQPFSAAVNREVAVQSPYTLLHAGIADAFRQQTATRAKQLGLSQSEQATGSESMPAATVSDQQEGTRSSLDCHVSGIVYQTSVEQLLERPELEEEIFGPTTVFVGCSRAEQMLQYARQMKGSLTASVFAAAEDLPVARELINVLQQKVGRIVFNGFPTGVQVNHAMMHGGPYPAAIGSWTSIGTGSIKRFARPVCFQQFPAELLPELLRDDCPRSTLRMIDGKYVLPKESA